MTRYLHSYSATDMQDWYEWFYLVRVTRYLHSYSATSPVVVAIEVVPGVKVSLKKYAVAVRQDR